MSGASCPSCGVAVLPGYVRCPKCRKPLPRRPGSNMLGGTAVETTRRWPLLAAIGAAALGAGIIVYGGMRASEKRAQPAVVPDQDAAPAAIDTTSAEPEPVETIRAPAPPDPSAVAGELERALRKERLWATVTVVGERVDIRSGSCADAAMQPMIDEAAPALKGAGLTKLRCLEQSGRVVSERDL